MDQESISYILKIKELGTVKYDSNLTSHSLYKTVNDIYGIELNLLHEKFPQVVSLLDFRVLSEKYYNKNEVIKSVTTNRKIIVGDYWVEI